MLNNVTVDKLRTLKLTGMADEFSEQLKKPMPNLDFEERLGLLIEREWYLRENRRLSRRLRSADFKQQACIEDINYQHSRKLNKEVTKDLIRCQWIRNHLNLLITGPTGCGKTWLACAFSHRACLLGLTAKYYRLPRLWNKLKIAKIDGTYSKLLSEMAKIDVIILDDWGIASPDEEQRRDLLEILDDRYQKKSTVITSQLPISHWHEHLNDATIADAILDRLIHNAIKMELDGPSLRETQSVLLNNLEKEHQHD
jgi:DNA replication protein DnaC